MDCYTLERIPDLTLAQYSAEESGGVDDVIKQHGTFYRQLNRKGLLFNEKYHIVYFYNPELPEGERLKVYFYAEGNPKPISIKESIESSALSSYFKFDEVLSTDEINCLSCDNDVLERKTKQNYQYNICFESTFKYRASLGKRDGFVPSSISEERFYCVNPWKINEKARGMGLFKTMQNFNKKSAYVLTLESIDDPEAFRERFSTNIQYIRNNQKNNRGIKDDGADQSLKVYDKFFDSLKTNPHYICKICAYADEEYLTKMLLDAVASEAVLEGGYRIKNESGLFTIKDSGSVSGLYSEDTPRQMRRWTSVFLAKEVVPFGMFPTLYPGETIEIPKESAPIYEKNGIYLGKDNNDYDVYLPLEFLPKHTLIAGVPGGGKTYTMLHLASQIGGTENNIPFLVLEPAKKEYRALSRNLDLSDLLIFSPGGTGAFPLRINPFEFPHGIKLSEHITNLVQVFEGAFDLQPPMPFLVSQGIEMVYRDKGWYTFDVNDGSKKYPSIKELCDKLLVLLDLPEYSYAPEIKSNLKSCLQVRIGSLMMREMGNVFNVNESTFKPDEWMQKKCVIELENMGPDAANFLTLLLLTLIREVLRKNPLPGGSKRPRHVIFLEEAHNLIGPTTVSNSENGDAKVASTKYIVDMLAEVRALKEAIIIADQLPTALAPQVTKNTSTKIGHKITAMDDRNMLASTMSADGVQLERMATFNAGHALCIYDGIQKPFEIQIAKYKESSVSPDNEELYELLKKRENYVETMNKDFRIMWFKICQQYQIIINKNFNIIISLKNELCRINENFSIDSNEYKAKEKRYSESIKILNCELTECLCMFADYINSCKLDTNPTYVDKFNSFLDNAIKTAKKIPSNIKNADLIYETVCAYWNK